MTSLENVIETTETTNGLVRSAWLVGLGIYAKGFEQVEYQFGKVNSVRVCLVKKFSLKSKKTTVDSNVSIAEDAQKDTVIDQRILEIRKRLGLGISKTDAKVSELSKKVDELTEILIKLS